MIDLHTHILPRMDDGSRGVEESVRMLEELATQGVTHIAATPHFYARRESPLHFVERRQRAYDALRPLLRPGMPEIRLGAEVQYYEGIHRSDEIGLLQLAGTDLLLLEMPFGRWSEHVLDEVAELDRRPGTRVLLAHIERYARFLGPRQWQRLAETRVLTQANADWFCRPFTRRRALRGLREGRVHCIGSDCHNLSARPPRLAQAREVVARTLGADWLAAFDARGQEWAGAMMDHQPVGERTAARETGSNIDEIYH